MLAVQIFETGQTIEVQGLAVDDDGAIFKGQGETENYIMSLFLNFTPSASVPSFTGCMLEMVTNKVRRTVVVIAAPPLPFSSPGPQAHSALRLLCLQVELGVSAVMRLRLTPCACSLLHLRTQAAKPT